MKAIINNENGLCRYVLPDDQKFILTRNKFKTEGMVILSVNSVNSLVIENVTPPADWTVNKYFWRNNVWELNPDWVDPATLEEELTAPPEA